jgi:hypothetical protein
LQKPQLHDVEEQKEAHRAVGDEEVLQYVPQTNGAQGSEVNLHFRKGDFRGGSFSLGRGAGRF